MVGRRARPGSEGVNPSPTDGYPARPGPGPQRSERGAVAVLVALAFTVFVILVALVIDIGLARDTRRVSQNAADASALAAANTLYPTSACPTGGASRASATRSRRSRATPR